jgi:hypothetical protein
MPKAGKASPKKSRPSTPKAKTRRHSAARVEGEKKAMKARIEPELQEVARLVEKEQTQEGDVEPAEEPGQVSAGGSPGLERYWRLRYSRPSAKRDIAAAAARVMQANYRRNRARAEKVRARIPLGAL